MRATRHADVPESVGEVERRLFEANARIDQLLAHVIAELEVLLSDLTGRSWGRLEAKQSAVAQLQRLLDRLGQRIRCPVCGEPARIRCRAAFRMKEGCFQFEHFIGGR